MIVGAATTGVNGFVKRFELEAVIGQGRGL